ncbi:MAG UNVERIFIED_CONTAM: hypothetical protein LVR18_03450 [Planctomycetaceae bacterium]|jgi:hypothetical protein
MDLPPLPLINPKPIEAMPALELPKKPVPVTVPIKTEPQPIIHKAPEIAEPKTPVPDLVPEKKETKETAPVVAPAIAEPKPIINKAPEVKVQDAVPSSTKPIIVEPVEEAPKS